MFSTGVNSAVSAPENQAVNRRENLPSSCLNNRTIEEFFLSDGSPCIFSEIAPEDTKSFNEYLDLAHTFHFSDFQKARNPDKKEETEFLTKLNVHTEQAKKNFANRKFPLVVMSSTNSIIAGTSYGLEADNSIVRMQIACVDRSLPKEDYELCFSKLVDYLSNPAYFPDGSKFVVMARDWSSETYLLKKLCTVSDYENSQYKPSTFNSEFVAYERPFASSPGGN